MFALKISRGLGVLALSLSICGVVAGQAPRVPPAPAAQIPPNAQPPSPSVRPDYILGPNDQVLIRAAQSEELNERPFRVDSQGFLSLPVVGRVRADGLTVQALEVDLVARLKEFIREPLVSITVTQFRNEPVFLVGAFRAPGLYPLQGRQTLVELLTTVGGLQPNASRRIKITRRLENGPIPLPYAVVDNEKKVSTVEVSLQSLSQDINPAEDIVLKSYDIISVDRAERVYVSGEVAHASALELGERESMSVAQALTEVGGFTQYANRDKVRVLRPVLGTNRRAEFEIDLKSVFEGKEIDFPLLPNDVLFVPRSTGRSFWGPVGTSFVASIPYLIITGLLR